jgi:CRP-like cAMP-binding protein
MDNLELVSLPARTVLYESGDTLAHVYFPTDAIISLLYTTVRGESSEIALVGSEGLIGVSLFMGGNSTPSHGVVQASGYAYRLKAALLKKEFKSSIVLQRVLLRYTQGLLMQMAQIAVCNRHHTVDQQLCRWLLLNLDRSTGNELEVTQEMIAARLGVRREGVTSSAGKLQAAGVIEYRRGHIMVLDRERLERLCCDCYVSMRRQSQWYLEEEWRAGGGISEVDLQAEPQR